MNVVEMISEKRLQRIVTLTKIQFGLMSERATLETVYLENDAGRVLC